MSGAVFVSKICGYIYPDLARPPLTAGTGAAADGGLRSGNWGDFHWWWVSAVSANGQIAAWEGKLFVIQESRGSLLDPRVYFHFLHFCLERNCEDTQIRKIKHTSRSSRFGAALTSGPLRSGSQGSAFPAFFQSGGGRGILPSLLPSAWNIQQI